MGFPNAYWTDQKPYRTVGEIIRKIVGLIEQKFQCQESAHVVPEERDFLNPERLTSRQGNDPGIPLSGELGKVTLVTGHPVQLSTVICEVILDRLSNDEIIAIHRLKWKVEILVLKLIALRSQINGVRLLAGEISEQDWVRGVHSAGFLSETQFFLAGFPAMGLEEIIVQALLFKQKETRLKLLVIDSLQLLPKGKSESIFALVKRIGFLSQDLDVPILVTLAEYRSKTEVF